MARESCLATYLFFGFGLLGFFALLELAPPIGLLAAHNSHDDLVVLAPARIHPARFDPVTQRLT